MSRSIPVLSGADVSIIHKVTSGSFECEASFEWWDGQHSSSQQWSKSYDTLSQALYWVRQRLQDAEGFARAAAMDPAYQDPSLREDPDGALDPGSGDDGD